MIGLCMIARNESAFLGQCLQGIAPEFEQIVIVDTGSTDDTPEIAWSFGAEVGFHQWDDDFSKARNEALELMKTKWVLILDADERIGTQELKALKAHLIRNPEPVAYNLKIRNVMDKPADNTEHFTCRLFPNLPGIKYVGRIHEQAHFPPGVERKSVSGVVIEHHGYKADVVKQRGKSHRNSDLLSKAIEQEPENPFHWFNAGLNYRTHNALPEAVNALQKCVELNDKHKDVPLYLATAHNVLAECLFLMGKYNEALAQAESSPEYCRRLPEYWVNVGNILLKLERPADAVEAYAAAFSVDADPGAVFQDTGAATWKPWAGMGNAYLKLSDYSRAAQCYRKAREMNPENQSLSRALRKTERLKMLVRH